jgi:hypothetical protein
VDLHVENVPLVSLTPHPRNPRRGDVGVIADSLRVNEQYRPIVVAADDVILAGNHTWLAAGQLGWDTIAVVRLTIGSDSPEARRILLADNRSSDLGRYDDAELLDLLQALDAEVGLTGVGYRDDDIEVLTRLVAAESYGKVDHAGEWVGMPEFESENIPPAHMRVTVHIHTEEDVSSFFTAIGKPRRSIIWWPEAWDDEQRCFSGEGKPRMVGAVDED